MPWERALPLVLGVVGLVSAMSEGILTPIFRPRPTMKFRRLGRTRRSGPETSGHAGCRDSARHRNSKAKLGSFGQVLEDDFRLTPTFRFDYIRTWCRHSARRQNPKTKFQSLGQVLEDDLRLMPNSVLTKNCELDTAIPPDAEIRRRYSKSLTMCLKTTFGWRRDAVLMPEFGRSAELLPDTEIQRQE
jgi:hypothetical protein